jgi:lipopolysaccharide transport system permease protein/teichoic acid transport system permease protein
MPFIQRVHTPLIQFYLFVADVFRNRRVILELTRQDFKSKYLGSYLGIIWAFFNPAVTILIFWFVFQVGFKATPIDHFPFILWLSTGMIPWFFFADSVSSATNSIIERSYLVQKVVFRTSVLPVVKILAALAVHLIFVGVLLLMFIAYGYRPDIYYLQVLYYLFASMTLLLGLSWITSSIVIFFKDIGQIVGMLLQFGFWLTPIFWPMKMVPKEYHPIIKINPAYYIIEGYRESFIYKVWFWQHYKLTPYFWVVTFLIFVGGALLFRRLRPHFADVL